MPLRTTFFSLLIGSVLCLTGFGAAGGVVKVGGEWTQRAPLPDARTEVSVATDGKRIFLGGGFVQSGERRADAPRAVYVYEPAADTWSHLTDLPEGVNHAGLVYLDDRLYVVGGYRENTFEPIDTLRIFDLTAEQWSEGAPLPTARGAHATVVLDGRIHAIGGRTHDRADVGAHEAYDSATDAWASLAPLPTPRNHHAGAVVDGSIVVLAGRDDDSFEMTVNEIYDPQADQWRTGAPVPTGRSGVAAAVLDGHVYLFGGETFVPRRRTFDEAERYDPRTDAWEVLPAMPTARHGLGAAAVDGAIHVISGGPEAGFAFSDRNERLVPGDAR
ncbi:Kelch repeat-containing protein [Thioalkalivibrio thiocyanodenitrificans]|uniref:Kelch repeat-containing protein n=1 Tax=Thioalkalivibrio thiocyanodenitrificans TaxID=243063 RepID=UPI00036D0498|nr:kelch repeat-containing protein [Thioalkalivibrio thiocyanodenitrificans]